MKMTFRVTEKYGTKSDVIRANRPVCYYDQRVIEDIPGKYLTKEFDVGVERIGHDVDSSGVNYLADHTQVITEENRDQVYELIRPLLNVNKVPNRDIAAIATRLLSVYGWSNLYENYDILDDQTGFGYMGGTGCGRLVHELKYSKILGVKWSTVGQAKDNRRWVLATVAFHGMLGAVKAQWQEHRHLREALSEDDLFVTFNAHPTCQRTVRYHTAHGYPLKNASAKDITCQKCAKALKVEINGIRPKETPDTWTNGVYAVRVSRATERMGLVYAVTITRNDGAALTEEETTRAFGPNRKPGPYLIRGIKEKALTRGKSIIQNNLI